MTPDEQCATIEMSIRYFAPVASGALLCRSRVVHRGRNTASLESDIENNGRLVARAMGTFAVYKNQGV